MIVDTTSRPYAGIRGSRRGRRLAGYFGGVNELRPWLKSLPFNNDDAVNDFVKGVGLGRSGQWRGIPGALADQVVAAIDRASTSSSTPAAALLRTFTIDVSKLAETIGEEQRFGFTGRGDDKDARYKAAMDRFVRRMEQYTIEEAQLPSESGGFVPGGGAAPGGGFTPGGGAPSFSIGGLPKPVLYVAGGVSALILLALVVRRRKKQE